MEDSLQKMLLIPSLNTLSHFNLTLSELMKNGIRFTLDYTVISWIRSLNLKRKNALVTTSWLQWIKIGEAYGAGFPLARKNETPDAEWSFIINT